MLETTPSSQGSKTPLGPGAGVPSPQLETVPLPTPPYVTHLPPPTPRRRRPGAALSSPLAVVSRGWLRRHRPAVVATAALLGAAVLVVLFAALAYHVTPSTVSEDYELAIEEPENVEVPLEQHVIEDELDTSRPLILDGSGSLVENPRPKDVEESEARAADGGVLVARWEEEGSPEGGGAARSPSPSPSPSPSRSRRHRTDDSHSAGRPPPGRSAGRPRFPYSVQSPHFSRGALDVTSAHRADERPPLDAEPNVIQVEVSRGEQGNSIRQWAALPFDQTYDVELDEIGNSVSETIKQASGTKKPAVYTREYSLDSDARHQSKASNTEPNSLESGLFQSETPRDPEESVVHTLRKWPVNHRLGQQDRLVTLIKIPGLMTRQKRASPEADGHGQNLIKRLPKRDGLLGSLSHENGEESPSNVDSSVVGDASFDRRAPFRGKRQVYWGPFYDPYNRFPVHVESKEDASSEEEASKDENLVMPPHHWYYTHQRAAAQPNVYVPYGEPAVQYWPSYPPHAPYYRSGAPMARPDFYRASSFQDIASARQLLREYEATGGGASAPGGTDPQSRQMEKAFETSVVAPMNISPDLFSRAMQSKTPTEFAKHLQELSETHVSNLRQSLQEANGRRLEAFTVLSTLDEDTGKLPPSDSLVVESSAAAAVVSKEKSAANEPQEKQAEPCQPKGTDSGEAAEPGIEKLFSADGIVRLINILPFEAIRKIIESLSTEALADLLKGLSKPEIAKIKNSLPPEKLEAIKKMFSPEELEEVKGMLGVTSNVTAAPAESAVERGSVDQRQAEASPELTASEVSADSSEEASEDYSDSAPGASTSLPLTAVSQSSTDDAPTAPEQLEEETARSFLRRNGTSPLLQKLRPGLLQQTMAAMGSPAAAAGMAQLAAQDQRVGRELDQPNPLDAALAAAAAAAQRQLRAGPTDAILSTLAGLAEDVHWIRMLLADSNATLVGAARSSLLDAARSSLLDAELDSARRTFVQSTAVSGQGLSAGDRERLAALPAGLAQQLAARAAGKAVAPDFPTGLGEDYTGAVEATASTAYTVSSPGLDATTPKTWTQAQYLLTTKPGVTAPLFTAGIHFPSQPSGSVFEHPAAHKTLDGGDVLPLPVATGGQHLPVCIYGHQHQQQHPPAPWPLPAPPQAAAFASAVAIVPQPQLLKPDNADLKDLPMLHHQQNVYNYYSSAAWPPAAQRHQHTQQQQPQQALLHPVFCGWLPSPQDTHSPPHSVASPLKPYFGWRADSQAGVGAEANSQQSAALQAEPTKADADLRQATTAGEAVFTTKPPMESEPAAARDSHSDQGKSEPGEGAPAPPTDSTTRRQAAATGASTQRATEATPAPGPCCDGTTDAAEERERANLAAEEEEERRRYASEVRPLQGVCPAGSALCADGSRCVALARRCDGTVQCPDASDEAGCGCRARLEQARLCDGVVDCPAAEDERACFGCGLHELSCEEQCVPLERRCDGRRDCPSGADEAHCTLIGDPALHNQTVLVSYSSGFLQRNWRGAWHLVCTADLHWAKRACELEVGVLTSNPRVVLRPLPAGFETRLPFLVPSPASPSGTEAQPLCMGGRSVATYVTCPPPACGSRQVEEVGVVGADAEPEEAEGEGEEARVVGGTPSRPRAWPWALALYRDGSFHCGATLIHPAWALSAAHCVDSYERHFYEVQAGMLRRFSFSPHEQTARVSAVVVHPRYARRTMSSDLSLLRLQPALRLSRWVRPACLPRAPSPAHAAGWPLPGTSCTVVGWGATREHGPDPDHLREVRVPVLARCTHIEDERGGELCAGLRRGGRDACQGDSGGPLLCRSPEDPRRWYVGGVVSHGEGCARPGEPGAYTRVASYLSWITDNTEDSALPDTRPLQTCPGMTCRLGTGTCLPLHQRCDRVVDCLDAEDELGCSSVYMQASELAHADDITDLSLLKVARAHANRTHSVARVASGGATVSSTSKHDGTREVTSVSSSTHSDATTNPSKTNILSSGYTGYQSSEKPLVEKVDVGTVSQSDITYVFTTNPLKTDFLSADYTGFQSSEMPQVEKMDVDTISQSETTYVSTTYPLKTEILSSFYTGYQSSEMPQVEKMDVDTISQSGTTYVSTTYPSKTESLSSDYTGYQSSEMPQVEKMDVDTISQSGTTYVSTTYPSKTESLSPDYTGYQSSQMLQVEKVDVTSISQSDITYVSTVSPSITDYSADVTDKSTYLTGTITETTPVMDALEVQAMAKGLGENFQFDHTPEKVFTDAASHEGGITDIEYHSTVRISSSTTLENLAGNVIDPSQKLGTDESTASVSALEVTTTKVLQHTETGELPAISTVRGQHTSKGQLSTVTAHPFVYTEDDQTEINRVDKLSENEDIESRTDVTATTETVPAMLLQTTPNRLTSYSVSGTVTKSTISLVSTEDESGHSTPPQVPTGQLEEIALHSTADNQLEEILPTSATDSELEEIVPPTITDSQLQETALPSTTDSQFEETALSSTTNRQLEKIPPPLTTDSQLKGTPLTTDNQLEETAPPSATDSQLGETAPPSTGGDHLEETVLPSTTDSQLEEIALPSTSDNIGFISSVNTEATLNPGNTILGMNLPGHTKTESSTSYLEVSGSVPHKESATTNIPQREETIATEQSVTISNAYNSSHYSSTEYTDQWTSDSEDFLSEITISSANTTESVTDLQSTITGTEEHTASEDILSSSEGSDREMGSTAILSIKPTSSEAVFENYTVINFSTTNDDGAYNESSTSGKQYSETSIIGTSESLTEYIYGKTEVAAELFSNMTTRNVIITEPTVSTDLNQGTSTFENHMLDISSLPSTDSSKSVWMTTSDESSGRLTSEMPSTVVAKSLHTKHFGETVQETKYEQQFHNMSAAGLRPESQILLPDNDDGIMSSTFSNPTTFPDTILVTTDGPLEDRKLTPESVYNSGLNTIIAEMNLHHATQSIPVTPAGQELASDMSYTSIPVSIFPSITDVPQNDNDQHVSTFEREHDSSSQSVLPDMTTKMLILPESGTEIFPTNTTHISVESTLPETEEIIDHSKMFSTSESNTEYSHMTMPPYLVGQTLPHEMTGLELPPDITTINTELEMAKGQVFYCKRLQQKVPASARCDGWPQCEDASDEMDCSCKERLLHNHPEVLCDGFLDCEDGSDEEDCELCSSGESMCVRSEKCISQTQICDQHVDCYFNEDEKDCFALISGTAVDPDHKRQVPLDQEGILSYRIGSMWRPICSHNVSDAFSRATDICRYLGFSGYEHYQQVPVVNAPMAVSFSPLQHFDVTPAQSVCQGLRVRCAPYLSSPLEALSLPSLDHESYAWPWLAVIYARGKEPLAAGVLITDEWVVAAAAPNASLFSMDQGLGVLMGCPRPELNVLGPNEQTSTIDSVINLGTHVMLHTRQPANLTKHVHPLQLPDLYVNRDMKYTTSESCVLVTTDKKGKVCSTFLKLHSKCDKASILCFTWENATKAACNDAECNGIVVCQMNGKWEPTAIFNGTCKFDGLLMLPILDLFFLRDITEKSKFDTKMAACDGVLSPLGSCIPLPKLCDGKEDCRAAWDETSTACSLKESICMKPPCATKNLGNIPGALPDQCVLLSHSCHENDTYCWHPRCGCKPWEFGCRTGGGCVEKAAFCDGNWDCSDGSDERGCSCRDFLQLSRPYQVCDGHRNCLDKGDERDCGCGNPNSYHCRSKPNMCIPNDHLCDGEPDCPMEDDEESCVGIHSKDKGKKISSGRVSMRVFGAWHTLCLANHEPPHELARQLCLQLNEVTGSEDVELVTLASQLQPTCASFSEVRLGHATLVLRPGPGSLIMWNTTSNCTAVDIKCLL